jgi:hypothetical protein
LNSFLPALPQQKLTGVRPDMLLGEPLEEFFAFLENQAGRPTARRCGDLTVIQNDQELKVTRDRISYLLDLLARLRVNSRPEELALVSGGYRAEVERMQREVLDCLTQPAAQTAKAG